MPIAKSRRVRQAGDVKSMLSVSENLQGAYAALHDALQQIWRRNDEEHELIRLLIDMLEAGDIKLCNESGGDHIQCWMAATDSCFAPRVLAIEDELRAAFAQLLLNGELTFSVDIDPLNVRWYTECPPVN